MKGIRKLVFCVPVYEADTGTDFSEFTSHSDKMKYHKHVCI